MKTCLILLVASMLTVREAAPLAAGAETLIRGDDIVTLRGGARFQGTRTKSRVREVVYKTALGTRTVPKISIADESPARNLVREYRSRLQKIEKGDVAGLEKLAKWCSTRGLTTPLREVLDRLLKKSPENAVAWSIVEKEAPFYQVTDRNPHPREKSRWTRKQIDLLYRAASRADFAQAAVVKAQLAGLPMDLQLNQAIKHGERGRAPQRWVAANLLGRSQNVRRVKTLFKIAFGDDVWQIRRMAVKSLRDRDNGTAYRPFVRALLGHPDTRVQARSAEALGHLGDKRAVPAIVRALKASGDGRPARSNFSTMSQVAYVKDYDVEVAQTAFIADPLVDIVIDGLVLDVAVFSVGALRRTYGRSLSRLTPANYGPSVKAWSDWWKANKSTYSRRQK